MAVGFPQIDLRPGLSGGSDSWEDGVGGEILSVDYFEVNNSVSVTTANPSSLTLTAQIPITKLDKRPTPGTASLTLTTFTPTVS